MPHKIGMYVRVSTEEQAQVLDGSIDSQQHRLKSFIHMKNEQEGTWGKVVETFIDDGYSAKDTRRPAYQRMMRDIRAGKINLILVTDLSRLSRNISDFCALIKDLEEHKAKFLSVKEQFDTSTPAGEMMIFNMINLAQFERKQTSERVSLNFHSRALRGLMNGGNPILGYDKDPTNSGKLVVNPREAPGVRKIFDIYLETWSLNQTAKRLNATDIRPKVAEKRKYRHVAEGRWTVGSVRNHLTNLAYTGKREVNKRHKGEDQDFLKNWQRYQVVNASWPAIVEEEEFLKVQRSLSENRQRERGRINSGTRNFFLLSGVLRCGECKLALIGQASHGRSSVHRYYGHRVVVGETIACKIKRFRADEVEAAVIEHLDEMLLRSGHLDTVEGNIRRIIGAEGSDLLAERDRVQNELLGLDSDIEAAFHLHSKMGSESGASSLVQEKLEKLAERKKKLVSYREELLTKVSKNSDAKQARSVIEDRALEFKKGWPKSSPATQKRLVRRLVEQLIYSHEGIRAFYVTTKDTAASLAAQKEKEASESNSGASPNCIYSHSSSSRLPSRFFSSDGASVLQSGGDAGN